MMKYTIDIEINLPVERVVELIDNPDNMKHWQPGFISLKHLNGEPGKVGAKALLTYMMGTRKTVLTETILVHNLPDEFIATYETRGIFNKVTNSFNSIGENRTLWVAENDFRLHGIMKVIAALIPGMFKRQSIKFLKEFKKFAESA